MSIEDAMTGLRSALDAVAGLKVYDDPGAAVDPPAAILGPPELAWETGCADPTSARLLVYLAVTADDRAMPRLWALLPEVAAAIDALDYASVTRARPGSFLTGGTELPCYQIETEVSLP